MPKFTQIPVNTFETLTINAGVIAKAFVPSTGALENTDIIGATSGGISFAATPTFKDWGEDVDNCKKNMKELKRLEEWDITLSGSFASLSADNMKMLIAAADKADHITLRNDLKETDFIDDLWLIADYGSEDGAFIAIDLKNALSTGGMQLQTTDKEKGKFAFTFTAHYSMSSQENVPCEIWVADKAPA